jgi:hypothetical protein
VNPIFQSRVIGALAQVAARDTSRVFRPKTVKSYVLADGTNANPFTLQGLRLSGNRQLGMMLQEYSDS